MSALLSEGGRGCGRGLLIRTLAIAIVVPLWCLLVFVPIWLFFQLELSIWWLVVPVVLFALILIVGGSGFLGYTLNKRMRHLDAVVASLGLTGSNYQLFYRQYHGTYAGRKVSLYFSRGPNIEIDFSTPLQTRMGVAERKSGTMSLAGLLGTEPLSTTNPELENLAVFCIDDGWTHRLLAHPDTPFLLKRLTTSAASYSYRQVIFQPAIVRLRLFGSRNLLDFRFDISPELLHDLLADLHALIQIAESQPAPTKHAEASSAERAARSVRSSNPRMLLAFTIGMVVVMVICFISFGVIAFLWAIAQ